MTLIDIGRVCYKIAGRESGKLCVVVDVKDKKFVLIDGNVKRRLCNIAHLEPTSHVLKLKKNASTSEVHVAMKAAKLEVEERKLKEKKTIEKLQKKRKTKLKEKVKEEIKEIKKKEVKQEKKIKKKK